MGVQCYGKDDRMRLSRAKVTQESDMEYEP